MWSEQDLGKTSRETYIQQQAYYLCLPTEGCLMERCARLRLSVDIYTSLN